MWKPSVVAICARAGTTCPLPCATASKTVPLARIRLTSLGPSPGLTLSLVSLRTGGPPCTFVVPAVVGGGTRSLPGQVRLNLALAAEHRFGSGVIYLCYRPA